MTSRWFNWLMFRIASLPLVRGHMLRIGSHGWKVTDELD